MNRSVVWLCVVSLFGMSGCGSSGGSGGGGGTSPSSVIGAAGGMVQTADGLVTLTFPEGALPDDATVTIEPVAAGDIDSSLVSHAVSVTVEPWPEEGLGAGAVLSFASSLGTGNRVQVVGRVLRPGKGVDGGGLAGWWPMATTQHPPGEGVYISLGSFSEYGVADLSPLVGYDPPEEELEVPEAPEGTEHAVSYLMVGGVFALGFGDGEDYNSFSAEDEIVLSNWDEDLGGKPTKMGAAHIFTKYASTDGCVVPADMLVPPPAPAGYRFVGRTVVVNKVVDTDLSAMEWGRIGQPGDKEIINSLTTMGEGGNHLCDIIVAFLYEVENCPEGETRPCAGEDEGECDPGEQLCKDNEWTDCLLRVDPKEEDCNGLDDDCDG